MNALTITMENFETEVMQSDKPVLLDFWAEWCGPCRMVLPIMEEIANEVHPNVKVGKINIDEQKELAKTFKIMTIPTIALMHKGKLIESSIGVKPKKAILSMLNL